MKEPSVSKSLRISWKLWENISKLVDDKICTDFSHAARDLIEAGLWLEEHKKDLSDPKKSQKLIEEYNSQIKKEGVFDWLDQLSNMEIDGIKSAIEIEKEKRIKKL